MCVCVGMYLCVLVWVIICCVYECWGIMCVGECVCVCACRGLCVGVCVGACRSVCV